MFAVFLAFIQADAGELSAFTQAIRLNSNSPVEVKQVGV